MSIHDVDRYVGERLKLRMHILGVTQQELGYKIGVTFQQVQKYCKAINRVSASRLYDIAKVLEVPISYFFEGLDGVITENDITEAEHEDLTTRETLELARGYHKIKSPNIKKQVFELVKSLGKYGGAL